MLERAAFGDLSIAERVGHFIREYEKLRAGGLNIERFEYNPDTGDLSASGHMTEELKERFRQAFNPLKLNSLWLIKAAFLLNARSKQTAKTRKQICIKAGTGLPSDRANKESFKILSYRHIISATRNGGTWLTQLGIDIANSMLLK